MSKYRLNKVYEKSLFGSSKISILWYAQKKDMTFGHVFLFGFRPPEAASTLWDFNARGGKAAPAPRFSPAAKTLVRRTRAAGQKAGCV